MRWQKEANPESNRAFALAAVRHQKGSPLISAQEKMQSDDPSQENPVQTSGDRLHCTGTTRKLERQRHGRVKKE